MGLAVNEVLYVLNAARNLNRHPDVAFVSYARWITPVVIREPAWNVVPDLAIEIVNPTNLAEEIDRRIADYFRSEVRLAWVFYQNSIEAVDDCLCFAHRVGIYGENFH